MAKFVYRMQSILDIKVKLENQAKVAYGIANKKLMEEQEKLRAILERRAAYEAEAKELVSGTIDILKIRENKQAIDVLKSQQRTQMMNVHVAEKNVEAARKRLNEVMTERKVHEKLKEHKFEEFKQEIQYAENKEIDELVNEYSSKGYGDFKSDVAEAVVEMVRPIRGEYDKIIQDKAFLQKICEEGAEKAYYISRKTMSKVKKKVGFIV